MKNIVVWIIITLSAYSCYTQSITDYKRDNNWCFGYVGDTNWFGRVVIDFKQDTAHTQFHDCPIPSSLDESNASISDTNGNLLFYCNGMRVLNKQHDIMDNGDSINCCGLSWGFTNNVYEGSRIPQNCIIIPIAGSPNRYYLIYKFAEDWQNGPYFAKFSELRYAIIDMSFNNGLGRVVEKNIPFLTGSFEMSFMTLCRHANGRDWWLLQRDYYSTLFHRILVTGKGFYNIGEQNIGNPHPNVYGRAKFSPDGKKFVTWGAHDYPTPGGMLEVFDFDRCTGLLSNPIQQDYVDSDILQGTGGCEISANSHYLYTTTPLSVYQYDLQAQDVIASRQKVATYDGFTDIIISYVVSTAFYACQMGPDNKIYIEAGNNRYLHIIESPDSAGMACNVNQHGFFLTRVNGFSIPNFPNFRLGAEIGSGCDTLLSNQLSVISYQQVSVYPNPVREQLSIEIGARSGMFQLYNSVGVCVKSVDLRGEKTALFVGDLPEGVYIYHISSLHNEAIYGKVIVQK